MKQKGLALIAVFCCLAAMGQPVQKTLSLEEYLALVLRFHPVAKQAAVGVEIAKANITTARGAFDPVAETDFSRKEFGGLLYYDHRISEIRIPTWFGVDVVTGIESLTGARTSDPLTLGNSNYFGFSVPVAKGLLMDRRRADLQQAKIFRDLSVQEQRTILNDLVFGAAKAYWDWWLQYRVQSLFVQAVRNAEQRFRLVKRAYELGDRPAIDTIEALAQIQTFQTRQTEIGIDIANAQLEAGVFLWQQNGEVYTLPADVLPQQAPTPLPAALQPDVLRSRLPLHPELQQYRFKLDALEVERRLKFQSLLPQVYLKYNQLSKTHDITKNFTTPWLQNNYRYGLAISVPLRFSEGRGGYRAAKLKIDQTLLQQTAKRVELQNKLQQYYNQWEGLRQQLVIQQQALQSFSALLRGEEVRFQNGESSLFFINARELKVLETQQKILELQGKEQKAVAGTLWSAGVLAN